MEGHILDPEADQGVPKGYQEEGDPGVGHQQVLLTTRKRESPQVVRGDTPGHLHLPKADATPRMEGTENTVEDQLLPVQGEDPEKRGHPRGSTVGQGQGHPL